MNRIAHQLKAGRRTEAPSRFLFVDTETHWYCLKCGTYAPLRDPNSILECPKNKHHDKFESRLFMGAALYWERKRDRHPEKLTWYDFDTAEQFWQIVDTLAEPRQQLCIFAFNFGFDLLALGGFHTMRAHGWEIKGKPVIDNPPFIVKARRKSSTIMLLDWYNYFRGSLVEAGKLMGIQKLAMPEEGAPKYEWRRYCRRDVDVLYHAVRGFLDFLFTYDLGTFSHTLAGQALTAFRHRFMDAEIFIHDTHAAVAIERDGYMGGRVEMFRRNLLPPRTYSYVDINSAFPAVMVDGSFPVAYRGIENDVTADRLREICRDKLVMARVSLRTDVPLYPLRVEARLVFPVGEYETCLATPELLIALERDHVVACSEVAIYDHAPMFRKWVTEIYALRKEAIRRGDDFYDELLKRLMNSLYGKFGQRNYDWETITENDDGPDHVWRELDRTTGRVHTLRRLGGVLQLRRGIGEGFNSFVAVAAHVTSAARVLLLRYIEKAGWEHTYYLDTDSLIVDGPGYIRLREAVDPSRLGALKLVAQSKRVRLGAPKNYDFGEMSKHKGRKKNARPRGKDTYEQDQFVSLAGALRLGWQGGPLLRRVVKHDRMVYKKGIVHDDDTISPFQFFNLTSVSRSPRKRRALRSRSRR